MYYGSQYGRRSSPIGSLALWLGVAGVVLAAIIAIFIVVLVRSRPKPIVALSAAPSAFTHFVSDRKSFSCLSPQGWAVSSQSDDQTGNFGLFSIEQWVDEADFQDGDARILIVADNKPQAMGQSMNPLNAKLPNAPHFGLDDMSEFDRGGAKDTVPGYQEGAKKLFGCPFGQGSEVGFTGAHDIHGLVATIMGKNDTHILVICMSQEYHWPQAHAVFAHVIDSLSPGAG